MIPLQHIKAITNIIFREIFAICMRNKNYSYERTCKKIFSLYSPHNYFLPYSQKKKLGIIKL